MRKKPLLSGLAWRIAGGITILLLLSAIAYTLALLVGVLNRGAGF